VRLSSALARAVARAYPAFRLSTAAEEDPQLRQICQERHDEAARRQPAGRRGHAEPFVTYAAVGDFNGDGRQDAVLRLRGRRSRFKSALVVFHASRSGPFDAHPLDVGRLAAASFCVGRMPPGVVRYVRYRGDAILPRPGELRLKRDAIELVEPESAVRIYYWDGGRYRFVQARE
jgi:hypothetical protein